MLTHLRSNVVAYLALLIALGGTSYAATALPRDSVGAPQIRGGAVRTAEVKDRSLLGKDFKAGQLPAGARGPRGASFVAFGSDGARTGLVVRSTVTSFRFTLPEAGPVVVELFVGSLDLNCPGGGNRVAGIYVDGTPVPGAGLTVNDARAVDLIGSVELAAGLHVASLGVGCTTGFPASASTGRPVTWRVAQVGAVDTTPQLTD